MNEQTKKIILAAKAGGTVLADYFGQSLETIQKSIASDFRTKADLDSEREIISVLAKEFPTYNILSEELGEKNNGSEYTFVIDPLDGTNNFVLGIPNFSISIGLLKNEQIIAGVIYLPFLKHTYWAEKGAGSFLDDKKLRVNEESEISKSSISIMCGYSIPLEFETSVINRLRSHNTKRSLTNWSPAYDFCLLASGKIEGIINNNPDMYDYAAGKLIASEAGALITDFNGKPTPDKADTFIVSNGSDLHQKLIEIVG